MELEEAELLYQLCQVHHALPGPGGVLDQDMSLLRMHATLTIGGYFGDALAADSTPPPLIELPMVSL